jgi:tryptophanyl-tRNA synthetase
MHNLRLFVAAGLDLDDEDTYLYRQSRIPAHSELTVILNCFTLFGELRRMRDFREKAGLTLGRSDQLPDMQSVKRLRNALVHKEISPEEVYDSMYYALELCYRFIERSQTFRMSNRKAEDAVTAGLFDYPVLMAADILLYGAKYVPVGDDQTQHVELARDIAMRVNNKFGELFTPPEAEKEQIAFAHSQDRLRIRDLADPTKKMSKSDESSKGVIFLGDDPDEAAKKVMGATTDSIGKVNLDFEKQPGISNLLQIHAALSGETLAAVEKHHGGETNYGDLKKEVAEQVKEFLTDFQARLKDVDDKAIESKLAEAEKAMNEVANKTLAKVQKAVGLRA